MVQINFAQKEIQCKIVYYGPGMSGKTTNLELVHAKAPDGHRGELTSIATTGERTLYFDYMPLDLGQIAGISTKFQLYTVPGQIYYKSTRRLVLQGVDGIVFVADSSREKLRENKESLADLEDNLKEMGKTVKDVPVIIQYNKRDVADAMPIDELEAEVNPYGFPMTEAIATSGEGVFPTLKQLAGLVLESVNKGGLATARARTSRRAKREAQTVAAPAHATTKAAGTAPSSVGARPSAAMSRQTSSGATVPPQGSPPGSAPAKLPSEMMGGPERASPAPSAPTYKPRALQDRVVTVKDLDAGRHTPFLILLGLAALIGALVFFVVTKL